MIHPPTPQADARTDQIAKVAYQGDHLGHQPVPDAVWRVGVEHHRAEDCALGLHGPARELSDVRAQLLSCHQRLELRLRLRHHSKL